MCPIATNGLPWSICNDREPCKKGWTDRDAVWDMDLGGPKELCFRWGPVPPYPQEGALLRGWRRDFPARHLAPFPVALTLVFPRMLLISFLIGQRQNLSSVTVNFPSEKSLLMRLMRPLVKNSWSVFFRHETVQELCSSRHVWSHHTLNASLHYRVKFGNGTQWPVVKFCAPPCILMINYTTFTFGQQLKALGSTGKQTFGICGEIFKRWTQRRAYLLKSVNGD